MRNKIAIALAVAALTGCGAMGGGRQIEVRTGPTVQADVSVHLTNNLTQAINFYVVSGGSDIVARLFCSDAMRAFTWFSFSCQRGSMRWSMRAHVSLSMHTSMDFPVSQRVEQCSTKSSASLSSVDEEDRCIDEETRRVDEEDGCPHA